MTFLRIIKKYKILLIMLSIIVLLQSKRMIDKFDMRYTNSKKSDVGKSNDDSDDDSGGITIIGYIKLIIGGIVGVIGVIVGIFKLIDALSKSSPTSIAVAIGGSILFTIILFVIIL